MRSVCTSHACNVQYLCQWNSAWPTNSQKLAGRGSPLDRTFVKKKYSYSVWERRRVGKMQTLLTSPSCSRPPQTIGDVSRLWYDFEISPGGCHCFLITPDFAVRWETLTVCPRFHSVSGRKRHVRAKRDLVILSRRKWCLSIPDIPISGTDFCFDSMSGMIMKHRNNLE